MRELRRVVQMMVRVVMFTMPGMVLIGGVAASHDSTPVPAMEETGMDFVQTYVHALSAHDGEGVAALYAEDAVVTQSVEDGATFTGREEIAGWVNDNVGGLPDLTVTAGNVATSGDIVIWEWTYTGTYSGQYPNAPAGSGQAVTLRGVSVMEVRDGLIVRETLYYDNLSFLTQIGVAATPAE